MPRKKDPIVIYGQRCVTLADLANCIDDMRTRAAKCEQSPNNVLVSSYVKLEQDDNGELTVHFMAEE